MSVPDPAPVRKPSRWGLILPFALVVVLGVAWSAYWLWLSREAAARMDAQAQALRSAGYEVAWRERRIDGYPFRLDVTLTEARIAEPSGWALAVPRLEAEASAWALDRWIAAAPTGLTFTRPVGGPVEVKGLIRASLSGLSRSTPNLSAEGVKLVLAPGPGAAPFALSAADRIELHLRPMPDDQAILRFRVDAGRAQVGGLFGRIAGDRPIGMVWEAQLSRISAFRGRDWPSAVRTWSDAGGRVAVKQAGVTAGDALIGAQSGDLSVGTDGRLRGSLDVNLKRAPAALSALGQQGVIPPETALAAAAVAAAREGSDALARATLTFQAGRTTLGPVAIGPAPRIY